MESNFKSRRYLRWLVFGSSTYLLYVFVASILAALISSLICNRTKLSGPSALALSPGNEVRAEKGYFQHPFDKVLVILLFRERLHDL